MLSVDSFGSLDHSPFNSQFAADTRRAGRGAFDSQSLGPSPLSLFLSVFRGCDAISPDFPLIACRDMRAPIRPFAVPTPPAVRWQFVHPSCTPQHFPRNSCPMSSLTICRISSHYSQNPQPFELVLQMVPPPLPESGDGSLRHITIMETSERYANIEKHNETNILVWAGILLQ